MATNLIIKTLDFAIFRPTFLWQIDRKIERNSQRF